MLPPTLPNGASQTRGAACLFYFYKPFCGESQWDQNAADSWLLPERRPGRPGHKTIRRNILVRESSRIMFLHAAKGPGTHDAKMH